MRVAIENGVVVCTTAKKRLEIPKGVAEVKWNDQEIGYLSPFLYQLRGWLERNPQIMIWDIDSDEQVLFREEEIQAFMRTNNLADEKPMFTLLVPEIGGSHVRTTFHGGASIEYRMRGLFACFQRYAMHAPSGHIFPTHQGSFLDDDELGLEGD